MVYGNPKEGGFVHGCLDYLAGCLEKGGVRVEKFRLVDMDIRECRGCFTCLRKGKCPIPDDVPALIESLQQADGLVVGASVRNAYFPALLKKFHERITYLLGFTHELEAKPSLGIGAVGIGGGKKHLGQLVTLKCFRALPVDYLFFRTGIPGKLTVEDVSSRLNRAAGRLVGSLVRPVKPGLFRRLIWVLDTAIVKNLMLKKNPDGVYDYVINVWREKGLLS